MTSNRRRAAWRLGIAVVALPLTGCGINPVVSWQPQTEPAGRLDSMATARADASTLRRALHDKADAFVGAKTALNDGLLGLGILTLGLAAGKVHRDAYVGSAALAGSAYLFGTKNLQDSTLQAYQSGIGAVNCAEAAVRPMQVSDGALVAIANDARALQPEVMTLGMAIARAQNQLAAASGLDTAFAATAQRRIDASVATYDKAVAAAAQAATLEVTVTKAAGALKGTLAEIHREVNKLLAKTVVDPSTIPKSLTSLVKIVGGFGSGLGIDTFLTSRLAAANLAPAPVGAGTAQGMRVLGEGAVAPATVPAALMAALETLAAAQAAVAVRAEPLAARLERYRSFDDAAELSKCGVADAASALTIDREQLVFEAKAASDQSKSITTSGGLKPYTARFRDSPTRGVEVINPLPGDRSIEIKVPKGTEGNFELALMITDAASPPQVKLVTVRVGAVAAPPSAVVPPAPAGSDAAVAGAEFVKLKDEKVVTLMGNAQSNGFTITKVESDGEQLRLTLTCKPGTTKTTHDVGAIKARLLDVLRARQVVLQSPDALKNRMTLQGGEPCLK